MKRIFFAILLLIACTLVYFYSYKQPSNDRVWALDQARMPHAVINGDTITIHDIRDFEYRTETDFTPRYYDQTFDLSRIKKAYLLVVHFSKITAASHTFMTFEFSDGKRVAISIEARRELGETYSMLKGLFNSYELLYVAASEHDAIGYRTEFGTYPVYLYPLQIPQDDTKKLFLGMINRMNHLIDHPEFYNTFFNSCTTNIADHANEVAPHKLPFGIARYLPGYADESAMRLGLLDTTLSIDEARKKYQINDLAKKYFNSEDFSEKIRSNE